VNTLIKVHTHLLWLTGGESRVRWDTCQES